MSEWAEARNPVLFFVEFKSYNLAQDNKGRVESMVL